MKRKVCGKYPASRVTALKLSRNTPRRKTGARTISRILSQRVIRCWGSSFLLWTAGWKQTAGCQESSGIQPGDFSVAYGTSADLQEATLAYRDMSARRENG